MASQANLINPGWTGHMPLIIKNDGPFDVIIQPYVGLVQLCLLILSNEPARVYGEDGVDSKYMGDDGGPSRYWLDKTIADLRQKSSGSGATPEVQSILQAFSHDLDEPTRKRFLDHVAKYGPVTDVSHLFESFCAHERKRGPTILLVTLLLGVPLAILTGSLPDMWGGGMGWRVALLGLTGATVAGCGWLYWTQIGTTIPAGELHRLAMTAQGRRAR